METTNIGFTMNPDFIRACKFANTEPTRRQASRFRMEKGRAYKVNHIIETAPPAPSWYEPVMAGPIPTPIKFSVSPPKEGETPEEIEKREMAALEEMRRIEDRNQEIAAWRLDFKKQSIAQWPKAWALRQNNLEPKTEYQR